MASKTHQGYQPIACDDWQKLLQSLTFGDTDAPYRAGLIRLYILELEHCLNQANNAIYYYEKLSHNYEKLVLTMEESRNEAYETIGQLKERITLIKQFKPLKYSVAAEEATDE